MTLRLHPALQAMQPADTACPFFPDRKRFPAPQWSPKLKPAAGLSASTICPSLLWIIARKPSLKTMARFPTGDPAIASLEHSTTFSHQCQILAAPMLHVGGISNSTGTFDWKFRSAHSHSLMFHISRNIHT